MHPQAGVGAIQDMMPAQPRHDGIVLAQVVGVSPDEHTVQVIFTTLTGLLTQGVGQAFKVRVLQRRAGTAGAILELPQVGEWGLVCFPHGSDQMAVWLGAVVRDLNNLAWDGMGKTTQLDQHESGVYRLVDEAGNVEMVFADGTYLRIGNGTQLSARLHHERQGNQKRNVAFINPIGASASVHVQHRSGTTITIAPDGALTIHGQATIAIQADGNVTVQSGATATIEGNGTSQTVVGGSSNAQFVVLLQGLANLISWLTSHTHTGVQTGGGTSGPPGSPPTPPVPGTDYTENTVAS